MTGVELSIEQRAKWRKDAEDDLRMMISQLGARACRQILTLLDALEAAEARVEPVEKMARDANRAAIEYLNRAEAAEDENRRLTALVEAGLGLADEADARVTAPGLPVKGWVDTNSIRAALGGAK